MSHRLAGSLPFEDPARWRRIQKVADRDQGTRLFHALYLYPVLLGVLYFTSSIFRDHTRWMRPGLGMIGIALLLRLYILVKFDSIYEKSPVLWRRLLAITVVLIALFGGLLTTAVVFSYGFESWIYGATIAWLAGITAGSVISFTPTILLGRLQVFFVFAPLVLSGLWMGDKQGYSFALSAVIYSTFLLAQGARLNAAYWKQLLDRDREAERNRELEEARRAADSANQAKSQFLANMSHEIRTPMHGILGIIQLLRSTEVNDQQGEYLRLLHGSAKDLLRVLNDILDLSKIEAGKLTLESIPFSPARLLQDTCAVLSPQANAKGLKLRHRVSAGVPELVRGDPVRLKQVLLNLTSNALKFTEQGTVELSVGCDRGNAESALLVFHVVDTGIGVPGSQQENIFQPFTQAEGSAGQRVGGTGLGLAISAQLVELMGGRIALNSTEGKGSDFYFTIELQTAKPPDNRPVPAFGDGAAGRPLSILLAEDNLVNQVVAMRLLTRMGHQVQIVSNGAEAVQAVDQSQFDVVLMDGQMPGMGGLEATRILRSRGCPLPIIGVSANALVGDRQRFLDAGMNGYVAKPFQASDLYTEIQRCLERPGMPLQ